MTRRGKGGRERNGGASGRADGGGENSRCLVRKVGMWLSSGTGRYEGAMMRSGSTRRFDLSSVYYSIWVLQATRQPSIPVPCALCAGQRWRREAEAEPGTRNQEQETSKSNEEQEEDGMSKGE